MAESKLTGYYRFFVTGLRDSHMLVEDINSYLNTLTKYAVAESEYFIHRSVTAVSFSEDEALSMGIKFNYEGQLDFPYNYVQIWNSVSQSETVEDEPVRYYFITGVSLDTSINQLTIGLQEDVLNNTQGYSDPLNISNFTNKTYIQREHRDRFVKPQSFDPQEVNTLTRIIDRESEDPNIVKEKKDDDTVLQNGEDLNWFLIYSAGEPEGEGEQLNEPIVVDLCASDNLTVGSPPQGASKTYTRTDFGAGNYYYFLKEGNDNATFSLVDIFSTEYIILGVSTRNKPERYQTNSLIQSQWQISGLENYTIDGIIFHNDGTNLYYSCIYNNSHIRCEGDDTNVTISMFGTAHNDTIGNNLAGAGTSAFTQCNSVTITQGNIFKVSQNNYTSENTSTAYLNSIIREENGIYIGSGTTALLNTDKDIIRTDSRLVKILKSPYCPIQYTKTNNLYDFGNDWEYRNGYMRYKHNTLPEFINEGIAQVLLATELSKTILPEDIGLLKDKDMSLESKLYHSDFRTLKLGYDGFSLEIKPERIDTSKLRTNKFAIDFKHSNTINSRYAFKIRYDTNQSQSSVYAGEQDVDDVMIVNVNNEGMILNNNYINYINNGYNYDKKAQALNEGSALRNAIISTITNGAQLLAGAKVIGANAALSEVNNMSEIIRAGAGLPGLYKQNALKSISNLASVNLATRGASSLTGAWENYITLKKQNELSMQAKLGELASQATTIAQNDDSDLREFYGGNKLHLYKYEMNEKLKAAMYHILDLTGYSHHAYEKPIYNSRIWYNYVQCEPDIRVDNLDVVDLSRIELLKQLYREGVTIYHKRTLNGRNVWNLDREFENYETWIVEGVNNE